LWAVTVDDRDDDPRLVVRDDYVPIGSVFPWDNGTGVVASEYTIVERLSELNYIVEVFYLPPLILLNLSWSVAMDAVLETEHVEYATNADGERVPIGPLTYEIFKEPDASPSEAYKYETTSPDGKKLYLKQIGGDKERRVKGLDRYKSVFQLSFATLSTTIRPDWLAQSSFYICKVNESVFYGFPRFTVLCQSISVTQQTGVQDAETLWDIRIRFQVNPTGYQPLAAMEVLKHDTGEETPIRYRGQEVIRFTDYFPYGQANFSSLMQVFNPYTTSKTQNFPPKPGGR